MTLEMERMRAWGLACAAMNEAKRVNTIAAWLRAASAWDTLVAIAGDHDREIYEEMADMARHKAESADTEIGKRDLGSKNNAKFLHTDIGRCDTERLLSTDPVQRTTGRKR